ncbi:MAG: NAD-dependent succinate-semialdehyde dehydrogenase [Limnohabitans sp.]|nr:NAD-dependent succinate-semialdehyde dehydrogenase [Limnohabitans sp.]
MIFQSKNPVDLSVIAEYPVMDKKTLEGKVTLAEKTFKTWQKTSFEHRATLMYKIANILRKNQESYARLITLEMGKILAESRAEIEKSANQCEYFANNSERFLQSVNMPSDAYKSEVVYDPIGCVLAIMPWNFPFWQIFRYAAPVIMGGNVTILKHAPNVCGCALTIESIFKEAGFPDGVFQVVITDTPSVENIIDSDIVQGITLTGSEFAGSAVAALAGKYIKRTVLELGGSDALIVLEDADIEKAATVAVQSRMMNAGQVCIAAKRFVVVDKVYDEFMNAISPKIKNLKQGNGLIEGISMGPLARPDLAQNLNNQLQNALKEGAHLEWGGQFDGCHFQPSLLTHIQPAMQVFKQETFGPLATVYPVKDAQKAVEVANNSHYGLGASIWSKDIDKAYALARQIEAGSVFINALEKSDSRLPLGGIKKSGYGREMSAIGLKEFMNIKSIYINQS